MPTVYWVTEENGVCEGVPMSDLVPSLSRRRAVARRQRLKLLLVGLVSAPGRANRACGVRLC